MNSKIKDANTDFLFEAILQLHTLEECYQFFEDLCTVSEIKALSQRIAVAKMLSDKRVYSDKAVNGSRQGRGLHKKGGAACTIMTKIQERRSRSASIWRR